MRELIGELALAEDAMRMAEGTDPEVAQRTAAIVEELHGRRPALHGQGTK